MIKIILVGATGAMEETMAVRFSKSSEYEIVAGITAKEEDRDFPIYNSFLKDELQIISRHLKQTKFVHKQIKWSLIF